MMPKKKRKKKDVFNHANATNAHFLNTKPTFPVPLLPFKNPPGHSPSQHVKTFAVLTFTLDHLVPCTADAANTPGQYPQYSHQAGSGSHSS